MMMSKENLMELLGSMGITAADVQMEVATPRGSADIFSNTHPEHLRQGYLGRTCTEEVLTMSICMTVPTGTSKKVSQHIHAPEEPDREW